METYGSGDIMKKGFWSDLFDKFEKDVGGTFREYDAIFSKWKNPIRPKVAVFSVVYDGVQRMDENGSSDLVRFQNALAEFQTVYGHPFTMVAYWRILKNNPAWTEIEVPTYQQHAIISRLRKEQQKEYQLINNLLREINRYMLQNLDRAEEETRVTSLPLEEPLKTFSL
uniref:Uncharacterized protein n=1 Tax=Tanacetum cinerariifolium TaxID=118510 RepID=A0A6L2P8Y2_TANCI|nr:hypothetical protein [Tanacetum cinerariifolium]